MSATYESTSLLDQYLLFHYGSPEEIAPPPGTPPEALHFPVATARLAVGDNADVASTLDLGCAVGRSAFELAKTSSEVLALDYSLSFIQAAAAIRDQGTHPYRRHNEAHLYTDLVAHRPADSHPDRIHFEAADAMALPANLGQFDIVHAANLICRLSDPRKLLLRLPAIVKKGGRLLLATPATWLEEFTPPKLWPKTSTLEYLKVHLASHFELTQIKERPFLIREHSRKFQFSTSQTTLWVRK
ncbi:MAG: methyltransferase domain-containing protein [Verrucomicrobiota bacterium]